MDTLFNLPAVWFLVLGLVMMGYVILDGFDLGVGILHLFVRKNEERRVFLNAIGPVWDGNEVWFVVLVGASMAGFPGAFATLSAALYVPITLLAVGTIFRAVAIEFRGKVHHARWRSIWDWLFALSSMVISFLLGVTLGNFVHGISMNEHFDYTGSIADLFNGYAILVGLVAIILFAMHGAIYLLMKTEGELHEKIRRWIHPLIVAYLMAFYMATAVTLIYEPQMVEAIRERPWLFIVAVFNLLAIGNAARELFYHRFGRAFISSALGMILLLALFSIGQFPTLIRNSGEGVNMTIFNAASSDSTLIYLLVIVAIGIPLALAYTITVYRIFRGPVKLGPTSY